MDSVRDDPKGPGFPIRTSSDQRLLPPSRSFSQGATSFIASRCQGIHQVPFNACSKFRHAQVIRPSCSGTTPLAEANQHALANVRDGLSFRYGTQTTHAIPCARERRVSASRSKRIHDDKEPAGRSPVRNLRKSISPSRTMRGRRSRVSGHELGSVESVVELTGFEPVTSCLQSRRSPS